MRIISLLTRFQIILPDAPVPSAYYNIYHYVSRWIKPLILENGLKYLKLIF